MGVQSVDDDTFDAEVMKASGPVVVDFWAEWCSSCKAFMPHYEALAAELGDTVKTVKLNVDENPMSAGKLGVRGLPTFMVIKDGKVIATKLGAPSKSAIGEWIRQAAGV